MVFAATRPDRVDGLVLLCPFLSGTELVSGQAATPSDRLLATVMFEDVVDSTVLVSAIGDDAWSAQRIATAGPGR